MHKNINNIKQTILSPELQPTNKELFSWKWIKNCFHKNSIKPWFSSSLSISIAVAESAVDVLTSNPHEESLVEGLMLDFPDPWSALGTKQPSYLGVTGRSSIETTSTVWATSGASTISIGGADKLVRKEGFYLIDVKLALGIKNINFNLIYWCVLAHVFKSRGINPNQLSFQFLKFIF